MTIEQMTYMSNLFLIVAVILAIGAVVMYFAIDINKAWHIVTGKKMKKKPEASKKQGQTTEKIMTQKMQLSVPEQNQAQALVRPRQDKNSEATTLLNSEATVLLGNQAIKQPDNMQSMAAATTRLSDTGMPEEGTVLLQRPAEKKLHMQVLQDVTYIHTDIKIG